MGPEVEIWDLQSRKNQSVDAESNVAEMELANKDIITATINTLNMLKDLKRKIKTRSERHSKEPSGIFGNENKICEMKISPNGISSKLNTSDQ